MVTNGSRVHLSEPLILGQRVRLQGEGASAALVFAEGRNHSELVEPFAGWITGPSMWQLSTITLSFPGGMRGAAAIHIPPGSVGCRVNSVTVLMSAPAGTIIGAGVGIGYAKQPQAALHRTSGDTDRPRRHSRGRGNRRTNGVAHADAHADAASKEPLDQPNNEPVARHWSITNCQFFQNVANISGCDAYWQVSFQFQFQSMSIVAFAHRWALYAKPLTVES